MLFLRPGRALFCQHLTHSPDAGRVERMSGTLAEGRGDLGVRLAPAAVAVSEVGHSEDAGQQRDGLAPFPLIKDIVW